VNADDFGLNQEALAKILLILGHLDGLEQAVIYGSRAMGTYRPASDIDLTLIGPSLTTTDLLKVENELDDLLLPYQFDLSLYSQIENNDLIEHIQKFGKRIL